MSNPLTEVVAEIDGQEVYRADLPLGEYTIGREPSAHIFLESDHISRFHAGLTLGHFDWTIHDFGSSNGTHVGGERILVATAIQPQQEVLVGNARIRLRRKRSGEEDEPLPPAAEAVNHYLPECLRGAQKYAPLRLIGAGGMGVVLEAEDLATGRVVALKTIKDMTSIENVERFIQEAQITAQLEHPNIVPIYELNVSELDKPFYTMKLVHGVSLQLVLQQLRMERKSTQERYRLANLLGIFEKVADAIAYAHAKGVVHRDLKPDNIMLGEFGEVLVMDWGLAKPLGKNANPLASLSSVRTMVSTGRRGDPGAVGTLEGAILGSPLFMSPEQASGQSHLVDSRSDVYALGAILYAMLTLQAPVDGADASEVIEKVTTGKIIAPATAARGTKLAHLPDGDIHPDLSRIVMKALSLDPNDRHETVKDLQGELRHWQSDDKRGGLFGFLGKGKK